VQKKIPGPGCDFHMIKWVVKLALYTAGADPGGGLWGLETPPPKHIREAKGMMCCYKHT